MSDPGKTSGSRDANAVMLEATATPPRDGSARPADGETWISALRGPAAVREEALAELHALLVRAARYELGRRRGQLAHLGPAAIEELATQAADDALMAILGKLDTFRGASRFTTWAYKFALLEAGVKARRQAWLGREISITDETWPELPATGRSPQQCLEDAEMLGVLRDAVRSALTPHQREVFAALALNGIPIDVLAERLGSTRGALYKTLHDARQKLRLELAASGYGREAGGER
jgi:RNA polymerase sigma-70 factor, ECF subfamily